MAASQKKLIVQTAQLIAAIRPSITLRLGYDTEPLDLLDDNGLMGWELGAQRLLNHIEGATSPSTGTDSIDRAVADWLRRDLEAERLRWRTASAVIWQLGFVLTAWPDATTTGEFSEVWARNVGAARMRARRWQTPLSTVDVARIHRILRRLDRERHHRPLMDALEQLAAVHPQNNDRPAHATGHWSRHRYLAPADRRVLSTWLEDVEPLERVAHRGGKADSSDV